MGVAHLALDLGPGHERGHRVDHDHVERAGTDEHVGDLEGLLARVGLGDQQLVDVDADGAGIDRIHRVLRVDVRARAAVALGLGHHVHGERRLARRLRAEDLDHPAAGQAPDAERQVERERARGNRGDAHVAPLAELHDRALAELLFDLTDRHLECLVTFHRCSSWIAANCRGGNCRWRATYGGGVTVMRNPVHGCPEPVPLRRSNHTRGIPRVWAC